MNEIGPKKDELDRYGLTSSFNSLGYSFLYEEAKCKQVQVVFECPEAEDEDEDED